MLIHFLLNILLTNFILFISKHKVLLIFMLKFFIYGYFGYLLPIYESVSDVN